MYAPTLTIEAALATTSLHVRAHPSKESAGGVRSPAREVYIARDGGAAWCPAREEAGFVIGHADGSTSGRHAMAQ